MMYMDEDEEVGVLPDDELAESDEEEEETF